MPDLTTLSQKLDGVTDLSYRVKPIYVIEPDRTITVEGSYIVDQWFVGAKEIIFKNNAQLVFSGNAVSRRPELFVIAEKITVEGGVGVITWQKIAPPSVPDRGQAATGPAGGSDGANGNPGAHGAEGATGITGTPAPSFSLFMQTISGNLELDFSGGPGGQAGPGQQGGDGGAGAHGSPARQASASGPLNTKIWLPSCERGPGRGGDGGAGGTGGNGGKGGDGGRGGTVTICSAQNRIPTLRQVINVVSSGGPGGRGGQPGAGGNGGARGHEGNLASFCNSAGRHGEQGPVGGPGQPGTVGGVGVSGAQFDCYVSDNQFKELFGFGV